MKTMYGSLPIKGRDYKLAFDLNVMELIQGRYGSLDAWMGKLFGGEEENECDIKALKFGIMEALNEGIEIDNEEQGADLKPFTEKQVGRILTEFGLEKAMAKLTETMKDSTENEEKNE